MTLARVRALSKISPSQAKGKGEESSPFFYLCIRVKMQGNKGDKTRGTNSGASNIKRRAITYRKSTEPRNRNMFTAWENMEAHDI